AESVSGESLRLSWESPSGLEVPLKGYRVFYQHEDYSEASSFRTLEGPPVNISHL
ncbi:Uncharacterized protein FKW44_016675, partial [Caligus rogercresseyi]